MKKYQAIASKLSAIENCLAKKPANTEWAQIHQQSLDDLMKETAPSGSGIDCGTKLSTSSTPNCLVFNLSYHHMDENGGYDGWTDHAVIVKASLTYGFTMRITGRNKNDIKDYLVDVFDAWLHEECKY